VAHTADDQAETVLMHILRGAGLNGLRGMLPVTPLSQKLLIRPMLGIPRADIEAYCVQHYLTPRQDSTNQDTAYLRNRLRHEVMPVLDALNPGLRERLGQMSSLLAADFEVVQAAVDAAWSDVLLEETPHRIRFGLDRWHKLPLSIRRGLVRKAIARLFGTQRDVGYDHIDAALKLAETGQTGALANLPDRLKLQLDYDSIVISREGDQPPAPDRPLLWPDQAVALNAPGEVNLPGGWRFSLSAYRGRRSGLEWETLLADPWSAVLAVSGTMALRLRARRRGDRFEPQGAGGSQKVNEFMINAKIPAAWRGQIPLLIVGEEIAWVCGWRVDARFVVGPGSGEVWLARFEKIEGQT
jgi:tRNA(Ile)-lysidine synthase